MPDKTHEQRLDQELPSGTSAPTEGAAGTTSIDYRLLPLAGYTGKTSFAFGGLGLLHFDMPGEAGQQSSASLVGFYSLNNQILARLKWELALEDEDWLIRGKTRGGIWPDDYHGLGARAGLYSENFDSSYIKHETALRRRLFGIDQLYVGVLHEFQWRTISTAADSMLALETPTGFDGGFISGLGLEFVWDERDSKYTTREGWYAETSLRRYSALFGSEFGFWHFELDGRRYWNLGGDHTIALRGLMELQSGEVPFWEMATLGGSSVNRGISKGRFRDTAMLSTQLEYRTPVIWDWLGFSAFGSLGTVGGGVDDLFTTAPKWTLGGGPRFFIDGNRGISLRLDVGFSRDDTGIIFSINEAF